MFKRIILLNVLVLIVVYFSQSLPIYAQSTPEPVYKQGELLVRFNPKENKEYRTTDELNALLSSFNGGTIKHSYKLVPGLTVVKLPAQRTVKESIEDFNNTEDILYAEPNYKVDLLTKIPNDTYFNDLWGLHNSGQEFGKADADIDAPEAWDIRTDAASDMIVAVLDTGIYYTHPDLAANMWIFNIYSIYNEYFP